MTKNIASQCVVCGGQFFPRQKAGEVSVRLAIKAGTSVVVAGPVCQVCAGKSAGPDAAVEQMRSACKRLLPGAEAAKRHD